MARFWANSQHVTISESDSSQVLNEQTFQFRAVELFPASHFPPLLVTTPKNEALNTIALIDDIRFCVVILSIHVAAVRHVDHDASLKCTFQYMQTNMAHEEEEGDRESRKNVDNSVPSPGKLVTRYCSCNIRRVMWIAMILSILVPWRLSHYYFSVLTSIDDVSLTSPTTTISTHMDHPDAIWSTRHNTTKSGKQAPITTPSKDAVNKTLVSSNSVVIIEHFLQKEQDDKRFSPAPILRQKSSNVTVTVWMLITTWEDYGQSFLKDELLERFGNFHYTTQWVDMRKDPPKIQPPCLLTGNAKTLNDFRQQHAPSCYTAVINDEYCDFMTSGEVRFYYQSGMPLVNVEETAGGQNNILPIPASSEMSNTETNNKQQNSTVFLPLGPRYDFYKVLQQNYSTTPWIPSSQRKYVFNAIFSKSTSPSRKVLKAHLLEHYSNNTSNKASQNNNNITSPYYIQIAATWKRVMNAQRHASPTKYARILHNSQFTLSPTGHNPECFRIYEAMEAGSIPIVIIGDEEYNQHKCQESMKPLLDLMDKDDDLAPMIILQDWEVLNQTLTRLLKDPQALDKRQRYMKTWYENFMRQRILQLEALLIQPRKQP